MDWVATGAVCGMKLGYHRSPLVKEHLKGEVGPQQSSPTECSQRAGLCRHVSPTLLPHTEVGLKSEPYQETL